MKTALLVVSFGTTHLDTLDKTIVAVEAVLAAAFPKDSVYRAFTSDTVRRILERKYQMHVDSVTEALARIDGDGYDRVIVQPTLLIPGAEYDKLCAAVRASTGSMRVVVGKPLLCCERDMDILIEALRKAYPMDDDTLQLFMGHGTDHSAHDLYIRMAEKMRPLPMRLCTAEGTPSFADVAEELSALPYKKIRLAPMLFVAGEHAKNDMAGDEPGSLRSMLEAKGYPVECILRGLGELADVQNMYAEKVREARYCF